jgi:hypothetical protein
MSEEISSEISWMSPVTVAAGTRCASPGACADEPHANATATSKTKGAKRTW